MCRHLTIIAYATPSRAVAQCEHGTLHFTWDMTTVRLRQQDFLTLARFLDRKEMHTDTPLICEGWCQIARDRHGAARLWIGQVGLAISAADVSTFLALIHEAADMLYDAAKATASPQSVWHCPVLMTDMRSLGQN